MALKLEVLQTDHHGDDGRQLRDERQQEAVPQDTLGLVMLPLAEQDGHAGGGPHADEHAPGLHEDDDGEGQREARDGEFADALADEDAVYNAVEGVDHRPHDGGDTIVEEEARDTLVGKALRALGMRGGCSRHIGRGMGGAEGSRG